MIWLVGGTGYLGTHLQREFRARGVQTVATGRSEFDLAARRTLPDSIRLRDIQGIVFLAGVIRSADENLLVVDNLVITSNLLAALSSSAIIPPLLFLSSLHVYSKSNDVHSISERIVQPRNAYGFAKYLCEQLLQFHARKLGFPLWIGRAGNIIAPQEPLNRFSFVHDLHSSWKASGTIRVNTRAVRDVVAVSDFAAGLTNRIEKLNSHGGIHIENVCSGNPVQLLDVAHAAGHVARNLGKQLTIEEFDGGEPDVLLGMPEADHVWGNGLDAAAIARLIIQ